MTEIEDRVALVGEFKRKLIKWEDDHDEKKREWLNQNVHTVRQETIEAGTYVSVTISPPPAVGGLVMRGVDPFMHMFDRPYFRRMVPLITDMLDKTIGVLRNPAPAIAQKGEKIQLNVQKGYAFVAMPMDKDDDQLVDVLEAIKAGAAECGILAERIDEDERNEPITDRMLESVAKAEFVIVDLTKARPNVFFEAGYAHGLGKLPIYVARQGTALHFDIKDYPVIFFKNMKELREGIAKRLRSVAGRRISSNTTSGR